jgi:hypothetical protein
MKTPKEEAKELLDKFWQHDIVQGKETAKQCALICVDKILAVAFFSTDEIYNHYLEVKIEINNL